MLTNWKGPLLFCSQQKILYKKLRIILHGPKTESNHCVCKFYLSDGVVCHKRSGQMRNGRDELESVNQSVMENIWFSKASSVARFVGQKLPELAGAIKRTTLNIIAELDELEKLSTMTELQSDNESCENSKSPEPSETNKSAASDIEFSRLPWELLFEEKSLIFRDDEELKARILALSLNEENFLTPFSSDQKENGGRSFGVNDSKQLLINLLFQHDDNLGMIHAKLVEQNQVDDRTFWKNYFFHCSQLREKRRVEFSGHDEELDAEIIQKPESSCIEVVIHPDSSDSELFDSIQDEYVIIKECG